MPYTGEWVEAEKFLDYKGVSVYHCYKDDDMTQGQREYWVVLDPNDGENSETCFDIRDLKTEMPEDAIDPEDPAEQADYRITELKAAIDAGELTLENQELFIYS